MRSKPIQYLSYFVNVIAVVLFVIFKGNFLFYLIPAIAISCILKLWAFKKAELENKDFFFLGMKRETKKSILVFIVLLGVACAEGTLTYFMVYKL